MKIKDVTTKIGSGATPTGGESAYKKSGIALIRSQNVLDFTFSEHGLAFIDETQAKKLEGVTVKKGDILLNITGDSIARCCMAPEKFLHARVNQHVAIIRPKEISPEYLMYYLQYMKPYLMKICGIGGTRNALTKESIEKIPFFKQENEKGIAALLSDIDAKIDNNNAIAAELEGMAKDLYDYWFVQFDFPDENGKPYKSSGGKMVWNEELKREIPEGWEVASFGKCIQSINTGLNPRDNFKLNTGGTVRYITVKNLTTNGSIDFSSCDFIDNKARDIVHQRSDISKGDILFASIAPLGRCFLIDESPENWDINESVFSIRPNYANVTSLFLYMTFMGETFIKTATNSSTGSVFKGIRINDLLNMKTIIPALPVLKSFDKQMNPMFAMKSKCSNEILELASLRDFLLPMLMNGQVSVREKPSISNVSG